MRTKNDTKHKATLMVMSAMFSLLAAIAIEVGVELILIVILTFAFLAWFGVAMAN